MERQKIADDNLKTLQRLQNIPRSYDILKWKREEEQRLKIRANLAKQPPPG
jgi:hypothetical protein